MKQVVIRPRITEKSMRLAGNNQYTFVVAHDADKHMIAHEISRIYNVKVESVRTVTMHGKMRSTGKKRMPQKKSNWKKAIVTVKKGQTIDAFQMTDQEESKK